MPIVFEEVSGEIVPERGESTEAPESSALRAENPLDRLRHDLALLRERQQRLMAD